MKREIGFYWVYWYESWGIAFFNGVNFFVVNCTDTFNETDFEFIGNFKIKEPVYYPTIPSSSINYADNSPRGFIHSKYFLPVVGISIILLLEILLEIIKYVIQSNS